MEHMERSRNRMDCVWEKVSNTEVTLCDTLKDHTPKSLRSQEGSLLEPTPREFRPKVGENMGRYSGVFFTPTLDLI
jgi:hypothetical protein